MEVLKLRPHHATEFRQRLSQQTDPKDLADLLKEQGYDNTTILTVLDIYYQTQNPNQVIEILPEEDAANDPICVTCVAMKKRLNCDRPLLPGKIGKDGFEVLRYGLNRGDRLTVEELMEKKETFGPHFRI